MQRRRNVGLSQDSSAGQIAAYDLEETQIAEEDLDSELIQQSGDSLNALINHRWVSMGVIAFLAAVIFDIQALMAMSAFLLLVVSIAWLWSRSTLSGIAYRRKFHHTHVFPDETTEVEIVVENRKWLPVTWMQIDDTWPSAFPTTDDKYMSRSDGDPTVGFLMNAYSLRWYERVRRRFELKGLKRGLYDVGPANLLSGDPFSLFERLYVKDDRRQYLVVYPETKTIEELGFPLHDPFGDKRVQRRLFEDPNRIMGVRDYQPQDSFRTVHWKATARTGNLQTKIFEPTRGISLVLALNIASFENYWHGYWPAMLEYSLTMASSIAKWAFEEGYAVGISCNGAVARSDQPFRLAPSRRYNQLKRLLEMLASMRYYVTAEFGQHLLQESPRLPVGASFVVISPYISDMIATSSLRLKQNGRRVSWVVLGKNAPPEISGIRTYHLPIEIEDNDIEVPEDMILSASPEDPDDPFAMPTQETPRQRYLRQQAEKLAAEAGGEPTLAGETSE